MPESRYEECEKLKDGGQEYLGVRLPVGHVLRADDWFCTVVTGDRLDVLAHRYFGSTELWWIICDWNSIAFSLELKAGTVLRIPSAVDVHMRTIE